MFWIFKFVLFIVQWKIIYSQFTGIALQPNISIIKDTQLGNLDLSTVAVIPPTSIVVCVVSGAISAGTGASVDHPFGMRYEGAVNSLVWHVQYDSSSLFKLNSASIPIYRVTVECGQNAVTHTADLTVQVLPNQRPAVIDYPGITKSFEANSVPQGFLLYKVTATDGDNDPLTYTYNIQPAVDYFTIDPGTQEIKAAVDFRSVTHSLVVIKVDVSDGFDTISDFTLQIQITNLNTRPSITNLPAAVSVKEDVSASTVFLDLTFADPDFFGSFVPNCSTLPSTSPSIISVSGSRIQLAAGPSGQSLLDFETTQRYQIMCSISDGYLVSQGDVLVLNVENVNESPQFNQALYQCQLYESKAGVSTCSLSLRVTDPENDQYVISIRGGNNNDRFTFVTPSADLFTFAVDYDVDSNAMPDTVLVDIEARDAQGAAGFSQIRVTVADVNDNSPVFPSAQPVIEIDDLTPIGLVAVVLATDEDSGQNGEVEYKLRAISPIAAANYLNLAANGQLTYTQPFPDSLAGATVLLGIDAEDRGVPTRTTGTTRTVRFTRLPTTTLPPPTTPAPTLPPTSPPVPAESSNYFDEPANIAMVSVLGLIGLIALLVLLFFCMKKLLLGYCCKPSHKRQIHPSYDDYDEYGREIYYSRSRPRYPEYPPYYGDPDDYIDPRLYRDPRFVRDPRFPLSAGSIKGEFYESPTGRRSKHSQLAIQPY